MPYCMRHADWAGTVLKTNGDLARAKLIQSTLAVQPT